jgi:hypothetical protein
MDSLKKEDFDSFLIEYFFSFLNTEGNYETIGKWRQLKKEVVFDYTNCPNRQPLVISDWLWKQIIQRHLIHQNYN